MLRPGGTIAVTVPRWLPELVCWKLSDDYHNTPGGHIRIYSDKELVGEARQRRPRARRHRLRPRPALAVLVAQVRGRASPTTTTRWCKAYHQVLVWDIMRTRGWSTLTRAAELVLDPVLGKSMVLYLHKPLRRSEQRVSVPSVPGVLTAEQVGDTAASIAADAGAGRGRAVVGR